MGHALHLKTDTADNGNLRVEDVRFLVGRGRYVDDIQPENVAYLGIVRSPYAHAVIRKVDFSNAKGYPDFILGLTGEDLLKEEGIQPITVDTRQKETRRYQLAVGKVRYVGEPVAAFVCKDKYFVEDIIDEVNIEYEQLQTIPTIEESKRGDILLYEDWNDNICFRQAVKKGDAEKVISSSKHKIKARLGIKRQAGVPIEPRSVIAYYDKELDMYNVYGSVQSAHTLRDYLSNEMKMPANKIHVTVRDVGGAFGTKGAQSYPEPMLACLFAKKTEFAVKWTSTRTEDLFESASGRDQYCIVELACDEKARITALRAMVEADVGVSGTFSLSVTNTLRLFPGAYKIPNLELKATCYVTNKAPLGPVRGAGRPEAAFFIERAIDIMARKLLMDPAEFRMKNLVQPVEMPYASGTGAVYDSGNFPLLLQTLLRVSRYAELKKWREKINSNQANSFLAGIGLCIVVEDTGSQLRETAKVSLTEGGNINVITGSSPHGQGLETSLAQICSKELRVPFEKVTVYWGDTNSISSGLGTFGSRSMAVGGSAVVEACRKVKSEALLRASKLFGISSEEISIDNGEIVLKADGRKPQRSGEEKALAKEKVMSLSSLVKETGPIECYTEFSLKSVPFASGAHLCALTIDTETGKVSILHYVAIDDCGVVINPLIVDGQLHGGIVHGIGGSLLEEIIYDEQGQLLTPNLLDYAIPSASELPCDLIVSHIETPSPITLNGAKGVGESGTIAAYPAIFNALNNALSSCNTRRNADANIAPATAERILRVLKKGQIRS